MRLQLVSIFCLLILSSHAAGDDGKKPAKKQKPLTVEQAADAVLAAVKAEDQAALTALAAKEQPDPWRVADELCDRDEHDAARMLAEASRRRAVGKLSAYVQSRRGKDPDEEVRRIWASMSVAGPKNDMKGVLEAAAQFGGTLDSVTAISIAYGRGRALQALNRNKESNRIYMEAGAAAADIGWLERAYWCFMAAGVTARQDSNLNAALVAWESCLRMGRAIGDQPRIANNLHNLGALCQDRREFEKAFRLHEESLGIFRTLGHQAGVAANLRMLGNASAALGKEEQAVRYLREALEDYRALGFGLGIAGVLGDLGEIRFDSGDPADARPLFQEALEIHRAIGNKAGVSATFTWLGRIHEREGQVERAIEQYKAALELDRLIGDPARIGNTLNAIGVAQFTVGDYPAAIATFESSLELQRKAGNRTGVANCLANLGMVQDNLGNLRAALDRYNEALAIQRAVRDPQSTNTLNNIGLVHAGLGNYAKAMRHLEEALAGYPAAGADAGIAGTLSNLGVVQRNIGNTAEAARLFQQALEVNHRLGDRAGMALTRHNLAVVGLGSQVQSFEELLQIERELGNPEGVSRTLTSLGLQHRLAGRPDEAMRCFKESLETAQEVGLQVWVAKAFIDIGHTHAALGRYPEAAKAYEQAHLVLDRTPSFTLRAHAWHGIAILNLRQGRHDDAVKALRRGVECAVSLAGGLAESEGAGARETFSELFDLGIRAAASGQQSADLLWFLEQGSAGSLRESLGSRATLEAAVIPTDLLEALTLARHRERRALMAFRDVAEASDLKAARSAKLAWETAQADVLRVAGRVEREAKHAAAVTLSDPDDVEKIQGYLAPSDALIFCALTSEEGVALVVRKDKARVVALPASEDVQGAIDALLDGDRHVDPTQVPALRRFLVEPLNLGEEVKRILVSPMGRLGYVPFSLLFPGKEVVYVPSGTTYGLLLEEQSKRGDRILGFGDPDYQTKVDATALKIRAGGLSRLLPLPATKKEIETIADVRFLDKQATETGLEDAIKQSDRWRSVHFACHGLVDPERPMLSALALTADKENDGFLKALEIFRMKIPADLVVMSACETGKGKIYKTEGIVGLTRAFMFAGAPRVICSLWKVDDEATQALMIKFYQLWNPKDGNEGLGAAAALKKAQAYVRDHPVHDWSHPYYWAAWVLWGLPD